MSKTPKPSTVLTRAAKYIDEHGLAKGAFWKYRNGKEPAFDGTYLERAANARDKGCRACALGAIYVGALPGVTDEITLEDVWTHSIDYLEGVVDRWPPFWNDEPDRTKDEVVQALKEAAKAARKDGK